MTWLFLSAIAGAITLLGTVKMRQLEAYRMAVFSACLVSLPCTFSSLLCFPIGIWTLAVLTNREVKAAFRRRRPRTAAGSDVQL